MSDALMTKGQCVTCEGRGGGMGRNGPLPCCPDCGAVDGPSGETRICLLCVGTGTIFPMRKDGQPDMRYARPCQTCPECGGTGHRPKEQY